MLLWTAIKEAPGLPCQMIWEILKPYMNDYTMTNNILQDARDFAKVDLFSQPEDNVKYTYTIAKVIEEMGHILKLIFTDRHATLQTVGMIVFKEELDRLKLEKQMMSHDKHWEYVNKWK